MGDFPTGLLPAEGILGAYALMPEGTQQLAVTSPNIPAPDVTWSSSDENIAAVGSAGLVTAVAPGTATITAESTNGKTCDFAISVYSITISPPAGLGTHTQSGKTLAFTADVDPDGAVIWSSGNPAVATASEGNVQTLTEGTAIIYAALEGHDEIYGEYELVVADFGPGVGM